MICVIGIFFFFLLYHNLNTWTMNDQAYVTTNQIGVKFETFRRRNEQDVGQGTSLHCNWETKKKKKQRIAECVIKKLTIIKIFVHRLENFNFFIRSMHTTVDMKKKKNYNACVAFVFICNRNFPRPTFIIESWINIYYECFIFQFKCYMRHIAWKKKWFGKMPFKRIILHLNAKLKAEKKKNNKNHNKHWIQM